MIRRAAEIASIGAFGLGALSFAAACLVTFTVGVTASVLGYSFIGVALFAIGVGLAWASSWRQS